MTEKLIEILKWPGVALIVAIVAFLLFRSQIAALIGRTKKIGRSGLEAYETQATQTSTEKAGVEEFLQTFDNPLLLDAEKRILKDLDDRKIVLPKDREHALVRSLASANLILHFEQVHAIIWASQLALLYYLNPRDKGAGIPELTQFYTTAKDNFPALYKNYSLEQWLGFLKNVDLVIERDSRVFITGMGREFLKHLIAAGKMGPFVG